MRMQKAANAIMSVRGFRAAMKLGVTINFAELYAREGLIKLDAAFVERLRTFDVALHNRFVTARADRSALSDKDHSQLLMDVAPHAEDFIATLFDIEKEAKELAAAHNELAPIY